MRTAALIAATTAYGLAAGTFAIFSHTIMPALTSTDDRTFVTAFQSIDRRIINPWFIGGTFFGALGLTAVAAFVNREEPSNVLVIASLGLYLVVVLITVVVHVPLGDAIKAAGDPDRVDVRAVRSAFRESRWAAWNMVRTGLSIAGFIAMTWALVRHGRTTP
jgi:uncharacterized membrane protein